MCSRVSVWSGLGDRCACVLPLPFLSVWLYRWIDDSTRSARAQSFAFIKNKKNNTILSLDVFHIYSIVYFLVFVFKSMLLSYNNGSFDFDMTFVFNQAKFEWLSKQSFALHCGQCSFKDWCSYAVSQRLVVALLKFSIDFVFLLVYNRWGSRSIIYIYTIFIWCLLINKQK